MHKTPQDTKTFIEALGPKLDGRAYLAVPYPALVTAVDVADGYEIEIGSQSLSEHKSGAYTGEVSGEMIHASGARFVLVGHSERRHIFGETDEVIAQKVQRAFQSELLPVLCIGETQGQREAGETAKVLEHQLSVGLKDSTPLIIAYEPVWAIGTGKSATPQMAQDVHLAIRGFLREAHGLDFADNTPILYGGSVKPGNASELLARPDIDGLLVGGASLDVDNFLKICKG